MPEEHNLHFLIFYYGVKENTHWGWHIKQGNKIILTNHNTFLVLSRK